MSKLIPNTVVASLSNEANVYFVQKDGTLVHRAKGFKISKPDPRKFKQIASSWAGYVR